jgi:hypothetical protein
MTWVAFEPTIPASEQAQTVSACLRPLGYRDRLVADCGLENGVRFTAKAGVSPPLHPNWLCSPQKLLCKGYDEYCLDVSGLRLKLTVRLHLKMHEHCHHEDCHHFRFCHYRYNRCWHQLNHCCCYYCYYAFQNVTSLSGRLPTAAARVRVHVRSCGICGAQSDTGAGFLRVFRFPLPTLIPPTAPQSSLSSIIRGWYSRPVSGRRTKWTHTPPKEN